MTITLYKLEIFSKLVLSEEVRESNNSYEVSKLVLSGDVRDSIELLNLTFRVFFTK